MAAVRSTSSRLSPISLPISNVGRRAYSSPLARKIWRARLVTAARSSKPRRDQVSYVEWAREMADSSSSSPFSSKVARVWPLYGFTDWYGIVVPPWGPIDGPGRIERGGKGHTFAARTRRARYAAQPRSDQGTLSLPDPRPGGSRNRVVSRPLRPALRV